MTSRTSSNLPSSGDGADPTLSVNPASAGGQPETATDPAPGEEVNKDTDDEDSSSDEEEDVDDVDDDESDYEDPPQFKLLIRPFIDWIDARMKTFQDNKAQHASVENFAHFQKIWRQRYTQMREERKTDTSQAKEAQEETKANDSSLQPSPFITSPPLRSLDIEVLDHNDRPHCPCDLDYKEPDFTIQAPEPSSADPNPGVTEDMLLEQLCKFLYGDDVKEGELPFREVYRGGLVLKGFDYMLDGGSDNLMYLGSQYKNQRLWVYCEGVKK